MNVARRVLFSATVVILSATAAAGQGLTSPQTGIVFYTENDDWPPDTGTDKNYTNGFRLTIDKNRDVFRLHRFSMFRWVPDDEGCAEAIRDEPCISSAFHFGQQFYTPDDISIPTLIPNDRPYAGWLYVGGSWRRGNSSRNATTDIYLGFTGESSLAEQVQTRWHRLVGATKPEGWDNQIGARLGVVLAHSRHWAVLNGVSNGHRWFELSPFIGGNVGNIMTDGYAGGRVKLGWNLTRDWTHTAIGPVAANADTVRPGTLEAFFSVDGRGRVVPYDVFLDAASSHDLTRRKTVGEGAFGFGVRVGSFMATYRVALISREYEEAPRHHDFKALRFIYVMR